MNKDIKVLIEKLFSDDDLNIVDIDTSEEISREIDKNLNKNDIVKYLKEIIQIDSRIQNNLNAGFYTSLLKYETWGDMLQDSYKNNGIDVHQVVVSLWANNVEYYKKVFDVLLEHDIKLYFQVFTLLLDDTRDNVYCIKDIIDFEKYKDIFTINSFAVTHGKLHDLTGFPKCVTKEIVFDAISDLDTMKGFPDNKYNYLIFFENSVFPEDWAGFPNHALMLKFLHFKLDPAKWADYETCLEISEEFPNYYREFKNFPYDFEFKVNEYNNPGSWNGYIGADIIHSNWSTMYKGFLRTYIADCLKSQYKKSGRLKTTLCGPGKDGGFAQR